MGKLVLSEWHSCSMLAALEMYISAEEKFQPNSAFIFSLIVNLSQSFSLTMSHNFDDDDDSALRAAMAAASSPPPESPRPGSAAAKRTHSSLGDGLSDDEDSTPVHETSPAPTASSQASTPLVNKNLANFARQYATRKKLKTDQLAEVDFFLTVR